MAKTIAPLLSFGASKQIAKTIVYSKWKGIKYARQYVIPANPNTTAQQAIRGCFTWVHDSFKWLPAPFQNSWAQYAKGQPLTKENVWASKNIQLLYGQETNLDILFAVQTGGAPPIGTLTVTPGSGTLEVVAVAPSLPTGWAITDYYAICMTSQTPSGMVEPQNYWYEEGAADDYDVTITGLTNATLYVVGAMMTFTDGAGVTQYAGATNTTATPTA